MLRWFRSQCERIFARGLKSSEEGMPMGAPKIRYLEPGAEVKLALPENVEELEFNEDMPKPYSTYDYSRESLLYRLGLGPKPLSGEPIVDKNANRGR